MRIPHAYEVVDVAVHRRPKPGGAQWETEINPNWVVVTLECQFKDEEDGRFSTQVVVPRSEQPDVGDRYELTAKAGTLVQKA